MKEPMHYIKDMKGYSPWLASMPREQYHLDIAYITNAKTKAEVDTKSGTFPTDEAPDEDEDVEVVGETEAPAKSKKREEDEGGTFLGRTPRPDDIARVRAASAAAGESSTGNRLQLKSQKASA